MISMPEGLRRGDFCARFSNLNTILTESECTFRCDCPADSGRSAPCGSKSCVIIASEMSCVSSDLEKPRLSPKEYLKPKEGRCTSVSCPFFIFRYLWKTARKRLRAHACNDLQKGKTPTQSVATRPNPMQLQRIETNLVSLPESAGVTVCEIKKRVQEKRNSVDLRRPTST